MGLEGKKAVDEMEKVGGARLWSPWCWVKAKYSRDSFHRMYFTLIVPDMLVCPFKGGKQTLRGHRASNHKQIIIPNSAQKQGQDPNPDPQILSPRVPPVPTCTAALRQCRKQ